VAFCVGGLAAEALWKHAGEIGVCGSAATHCRTLKVLLTAHSRRSQGFPALRRSVRIADIGNNAQGIYEGTANPKRPIYGT
tara:strand:+ start:457 stop:699 length:243 start_codon:yes stop_codon:yes gene_type:complete